MSPESRREVSRDRESEDAVRGRREGRARGQGRRHREQKVSTTHAQETGGAATAAESENLPAAPGAWSPGRSSSASAAACSVPAPARHHRVRRAGVARCCSPVRRSAPTAATTTRWPTRLERVLDEGGAGAFGRAVERVVVDRGEMTLFVAREHLLAVARALRDAPELRFEMCSGVSGVHYPARGRPRAARRLPLPVDHPRRQADPRRGHLPRRRPRTSPRSSRSTRPTTGTSARRGTCSGSSSTATRP